MEANDLREILDAHAKWLRGEAGGCRADLSEADLYGANLRGANLRGANLHGANLRGANLRWADLSEADLSEADLLGADLLGADLRGADLLGADLRGADLREADLSEADLRGADLRGADLRWANLHGADLHGADLRGADLSEADLSEADLSEADLRGANLSPIRDDLFDVLDAAPAEVPSLLEALREGRVDGSTYEGDCACLVGTIAKVRGVSHFNLGTLRPDPSRPAEKWFLAIRRGDTPATSPVAAITEGWIVSWLEKRAG